MIPANSMTDSLKEHPEGLYRHVTVRITVRRNDAINDVITV